MFDKNQYLLKYQKKWYHQRTPAQKAKARLRSTQSKRNKKKAAIDLLGGKCQRCGYDECIAALEFHHPNPDTKTVPTSRIMDLSWLKLKEEIKKCKLLCANCHRREHYLHARI